MNRVWASTSGVAALLGLVLIEVSACSGTGDRAQTLGPGVGGAGASDDAGGSLLFGAGGGGLLGNSGAAGTSTITQACLAEVQKGELLPLDLYVLLDRSASMTDPTSTGESKWDAVRGAFESFVKDPASAGLGVGLQYFPLQKAGVPATCTTHAECGVGGPCFITTCDNQSTIDPCTRDADCGVRGHCVPFGGCSTQPVNADPIFCSPIGSRCQVGYGTCLDLSSRYCLNGVDCVADHYAAPAVPIVTLPAGAPQIVTSIDGTVPQGRTPTAPALQGAVQHAHEWALANPSHTVVAVLATDGLPTECTPLDIGPVAALAAAGVQGTPKIPTFVIGVFGPGDTDSPTNLQTIAKSGGTDHAFIVDTSGDVTAEFRKALDAIRGSSLLQCDLEVPKSKPGAALDFSLVNLALIDANEKSSQLVYVNGEAACGANPGRGWHYDVDPQTA
ncbi:MAG TPA: vWA domain-containing protein, partial [Polyangiaceae bacterium]